MRRRTLWTPNPDDPLLARMKPEHRKGVVILTPTPPLAPETTKPRKKKGPGTR